MKVMVVRPEDLGVGEEKRWSEFQRSSLMAGHPCLSLTYVRACCRADPRGRVAVVEDDGEIRAFVPYTRGDGGIAGTIGGGHTMLDGIVASGGPLDLRAVIRGAGLRGWRFVRATLDEQALDPYRYQGSCNVRQAYFADLSNGHDSYLKGLPKGGAKEASRATRRRLALEREFGEVTFEWDSGDPAYLSWLLDRKSEQFAIVQNWLTDPATRAFVHELAEGDDADCKGVTSALCLGGKPLAVTFSLRRGPVLSGWLTGYDPEFAKYSPGTLVLLDLISGAAERGVEILDFGHGGGLAKERFASGSYELTGGGVWASRLEAAARTLYRRVTSK